MYTLIEKFILGEYIFYVIVFELDTRNQHEMESEIKMYFKRMKNNCKRKNNIYIDINKVKIKNKNSDISNLFFFDLFTSF